MNHPEPLYPVSKIAQAAGTSKQQIYQLIYSGRLHAIQLSGAAGKPRWRIPESSWNEFLSVGKGE